MVDYEWNPFKWDMYDNPYATWLYDEEWSKKKYRQFTLLDSIGPIRDYNSMLLAVREGEEYLDRYGMDYSDIHNPRKLPGSGETSRVVGGALNFFSSNIGKLYR